MGRRKPPAAARPSTLLDDDAVARTLARIAHEIIERNDASRTSRSSGSTRAACRSRSGCARSSPSGAASARRIGTVDITFHRDDVIVRAGGAPRTLQPIVHGTQLDFALEGRTCVLVDDVLYTGRTIRAAIDALLEYGRPRACSSPCWSIAGTGAADPAGLRRARTCRPRRSERVEVESGRDRRRGSRDPHRAGGHRCADTTGRRHLISVSDLERDDVERSSTPPARSSGRSTAR